LEERKKGIFYFHVPSNANFETSLSSYLQGDGFAVENISDSALQKRPDVFEKYFSAPPADIFSSVMPKEADVFQLLMRDLEQAAQDFLSFSVKVEQQTKQNVYTKPILILDELQNISSHPALLKEILKMAEGFSKSGRLKVVIGTSSPSLESSFASSENVQFFEVPLLSEDRAVSYLAQRGLDGEIATRAVRELTGGNFALLNQILTPLSNGVSFQTLKEQLFAELTKEFDFAGLLTLDKHPEGGQVLHFLLSSNNISSSTPKRRLPFDEFSRVLHNDRRHQSFVLSSPRVLRRYWSDQTIGFASPAAESFARQVVMAKST